MKFTRRVSMKIGWIGTGIMGSPMCGHLMDTGHDAVIYNRTKAKTAELEKKGASVAMSPGEAARGRDVVFTIVGYPADVEEVYFGEQGILDVVTPGTILVDMTTSSPDLAIRIAEAAKEKGVFSLDAPVSGGDVGAREARLAIMVGGEQEAFERVKPMFDAMGKTVALLGPSGKRTAYQNGESNCHCRHHDRNGGGPALCPARRFGPERAD
jgi:3-hydroxyisobutyrate dehydrogenase